MVELSKKEFNFLEYELKTRLSASLDSKNFKKGVYNGLALKHEFGTQKRHSTLSKCRLAQTWATARGHLD